MSDEAQDAFGDFVRARSLHLLKLALLLTGQNRADAEDLLQMALERAYRRKAWLLRDGSPEPYVRRVLVNASVDRWRRLRRRREAPLDELGDDLAVHDQTGQIADRDLLVRSLAVLSSRQRAVLVLRFWEDMSETEIAGLLGCSPGTVRSHASHGLSRLRQLSGIHTGQPAAHTEVHESSE